MGFGFWEVLRIFRNFGARCIVECLRGSVHGFPPNDGRRDIIGLKLTQTRDVALWPERGRVRRVKGVLGAATQ